MAGLLELFPFSSTHFYYYLNSSTFPNTFMLSLIFAIFIRANSISMMILLGHVGTLMGCCTLYLHYSYKVLRVSAICIVSFDKYLLGCKKWPIPTLEIILVDMWFSKIYFPGILKESFISIICNCPYTLKNNGYGKTRTGKNFFVLICFGTTPRRTQGLRLAPHTGFPQAKLKVSYRVLRDHSFLVKL